MDTAMRLSFKLDDDLQKDPSSCVSSCLSAFMGRKGTIVGFSDEDMKQEKQFEILPGDAVYPICSGGVCRSQTLWAKLHSYQDKIVLFPPHAARHGWDPYNGRVNRSRNIGQEDIPDDFFKYFKLERATRFGFEFSAEWAQMAVTGRLDEISEYYSVQCFGPNSSFLGRRGKRRVYIAFSNNIHVAMHRLIQANESLSEVVLVAIDWEDMVTHPPAHLNIASRSSAAYSHFDRRLSNVLDTNLSKI